MDEDMVSNIRIIRLLNQAAKLDSYKSKIEIDNFPGHLVSVNEQRYPVFLEALEPSATDLKNFDNFLHDVRVNGKLHTNRTNNGRSLLLVMSLGSVFLALACN